MPTLSRLPSPFASAVRRTAWTACVAAVALAAAGGPASAHDTWFERLSPPGAPALLALGTGNQFPALETGVGAEYLTQAACRSAAGTSALVPVRNAKTALLLRAPAGAHSCWLQMTPFDIQLAPDKVPPYLDEMNASPSLRATWAAMQARGLRWQERYTKHARIELGGGAVSRTGTPNSANTNANTGTDTSPDASNTSSTAPAPLGMDAVLQRQRVEWLFTVLRDGNPLPDLAVELRSATQATGTWYRTDSQGQLRVPPPPAGRWLLRAIDLRAAGADADRWDSRFLTLAFDGGS